MKPILRVRVGLLAVLVSLALLALPRPAAAGDYSMPSVTIDAMVMENGDLRVTESRVFDFDDSVNGVFWNIPFAANQQGAQSSVVVEGVRVVAEDGEPTSEVYAETPYASSGDSGVYTVWDGGGFLELKVFSPHASGHSVEVAVSYVLSGAVMAWSDTAELYWQFVGPEWDESSHNVQMNVGFEAFDAGASSAALEGDPLRAWGHGPVDAALEVMSSDGLPGIRYVVPRVEDGEFAEARAVFPVSWVPGLAPVAEARLESVLDQERVWAEEANARREAAWREAITVNGFIVVSSVALLATTVFLRFKRYRSPKPVFEETYHRDVPSCDHPAVLAAFMNGGTVPDEAFVATLMKLTDDGVVSLRKESRERKKLFKVARGDVYSLEMLAREKAEDIIDRCALDLYFGNHAANGDIASFAELEYRAENDSEDTGDLLRDFKDEVAARLEERGLVDLVPSGFRFAVSGLAIAIAVLAVFFIMWSDGALVWLSLLGIVLAAFSMGFALTAHQYSQETVELRARCVALKRWLEDFTRLGEAVPGDLVLWNKLLVMAVAFGVSEEVVRQLADAVPRDLREDGHGGYYYPLHYWYYSPGAASSPMESMHQAYSATTAELMQSTSSSSGGFGGGFSGGGGGGVGGGGGGTF